MTLKILFHKRKLWTKPFQQRIGIGTIAIIVPLYQTFFKPIGFF